MTKGSYAVGEDAPSPQRKDTSYRSFICALLIFLCICLIVLLASINWGGRKAKPESNHGGESSAHRGDHVVEDNGRNEARRNQTHEKIRVYEETTTQKIVKEAEATRRFEEDKTTQGSRDVFPKKDIEEVTEPESEEKVDATTQSERHTSSSRKVDEEKGSTTEANQGRIEYAKLTTTGDIDEGSEEPEVSSTTGQATEAISTTVDSHFEQQNEHDDSFKSVINATTTDEAQQETTTEESTLFAKIKLLITSTTESDESTTEQEQQNEDHDVSTSEAEEPTTQTQVSVMESDPEDLTEATEIPETLSLVLTTTPRANASQPSTSTTTTEIFVMESDPDDFTEPIVVKTETFTSSPLLRSFNPVCQTPTCKAASSRMLSMMNHSAEPCEDFYEFACGRSYHPEEESSQELNLLEEQLSKVNDSSAKFVLDFNQFYQSCLGYEDKYDYKSRMEKLEELLDEVGQFHFNESAEIDLTELVSSLVLRQSMPLFDVGIDVDKQTSNLILQLNLPHQSFLRAALEDWSELSLLKKLCLRKQESLVLEDQISLTDVYSSYEGCQGDYGPYVDSVGNVLRELKAFSSLSPNDSLKETTNTKMNIEFEVLDTLKDLLDSGAILKSFMNKKYEMRRIVDLQTHFGLLDWKRLFQTLSGHQIQDNTLVQVYFADYFRKLFNPNKVEKIRKSPKVLNNVFLAIHAYDLFVNTVLPKEKFKRPSFCMDVSKKLLPDVWTYFVQNTISTHQQTVDNNKLKKLFEELKLNFCKSLNGAKWIDENTKVAIVKKCNNLNLVTFTPLDSASLAKNYQELNVTDDYPTNLINLLENYKRMVYSTAGTPISANTIFSYFLDPLDVKPLTFYANPMIVVPLGLMRKTPTGLPDYMIKTRAGFAIARQLARHFDPTGMTYGITLTSTSKSSYTEFVETMKTIMDYSSPRIFNDKNISFALNGSLSINERIVDNTAFRIIYDSVNFAPDADLLPWISSDYAREKVFFIAIAQEMCKKTSMLDFMLQVFEERHLPAVLRVENIIGNSQQFVSKFGCGVGSGMDFSQKLQFPFLEVYEDDYEGGDDVYQG